MGLRATSQMLLTRDEYNLENFKNNNPPSLPHTLLSYARYPLPILTTKHPPSTLLNNSGSL